MDQRSPSEAIDAQRWRREGAALLLLGVHREAAIATTKFVSYIKMAFNVRHIPSFLVGSFYMDLIAIVNFLATIDFWFDISKKKFNIEERLTDYGCIIEQSNLDKVILTISELNATTSCLLLAAQVLQLILLSLVVVGIKEKRSLLMAPWVYLNMLGLVVVFFNIGYTYFPYVIGDVSFSYETLVNFIDLLALACKCKTIYIRFLYPPP
uniref:Uncharacterized protein n=1 Tax=Stomoxys calcitrans TaxID=35570 RepID=A0A1I8NVT8_STOCA